MTEHSSSVGLSASKSGLVTADQAFCSGLFLLSLFAVSFPALLFVFLADIFTPQFLFSFVSCFCDCPASLPECSHPLPVQLFIASVLSVKGLFLSPSFSVSIHHMFILPPVKHLPPCVSCGSEPFPIQTRLRHRHHPSLL